MWSGDRPMPRRWPLSTAIALHCCTMTSKACQAGLFSHNSTLHGARVVEQTIFGSARFDVFLDHTMLAIARSCAEVDPWTLPRHFGSINTSILHPNARPCIADAASRSLECAWERRSPLSTSPTRAECGTQRRWSWACDECCTTQLNTLRTNEHNSVAARTHLSGFQFTHFGRTMCSYVDKSHVQAKPCFLAVACGSTRVRQREAYWAFLPICVRLRPAISLSLSRDALLHVTFVNCRRPVSVSSH
jgi:hypothetical protein